MKKLLVIEDNRSLAKSMRGWLSRHYDVQIASDGYTGISYLAKERFDLIILDLGLPDMSGQEVCRQVRGSGIKTPLLVLTAADEITTRVSLLDSGADDYLLKPFFIGELQARLRALLRRSQGEPKAGTVISVGDLQLDSNRRQVERGGGQISLRRKEFDILEYLMHNSGTVVTRSMILDNIWEPGTERWNNTVDVHVKYLRDKIDKPFQHKLIKTAYGVGYMIDDQSN